MHYQSCKQGPKSPPASCQPHVCHSNTEVGGRAQRGLSYNPVLQGRKKTLGGTHSHTWPLCTSTHRLAPAPTLLVRTYMVALGGNRYLSCIPSSTSVSETPDTLVLVPRPPSHLKDMLLTDIQIPIT